MELVVIAIEDLADAYDVDPYRVLKVSRRTRAKIKELTLEYVVEEINRVFERERMPAMMDPDGEIIIPRHALTAFQAMWVLGDIRSKLEEITVPPSVYMHLVK